MIVTGLVDDDNRLKEAVARIIKEKPEVVNLWKSNLKKKHYTKKQKQHCQKMIDFAKELTKEVPIATLIEGELVKPKGNLKNAVHLR